MHQHCRARVTFDKWEYTESLFIFDKDGTLIDFHAMWGDWITTLARRLEAYSYVNIAGQLYARAGFDAASRTIDPGAPLAIGTMAELYALAEQVLRDAGLTPGAAAAAAQAAWYIPDPAALARPLADLPALFGALHARGCRIAVATTDDRAPTLATFEALGVLGLLDGLACGDDGHPIKPAPDAVLKLCAQLGIAPANAVVIGDTAADLRMARAAGAGLAVGVLSGVGTHALLEPLADALLPSIDALLAMLDSGQTN